MCEETIDAMAEEIEDLKAWCAKLRAALAGMMQLDGDIDDVEYLDRIEMSMLGPTYWDSPEETAIKLLRETAPAKEDKHAD